MCEKALYSERLYYTDSEDRVLIKSQFDQAIRQAYSVRNQLLQPKLDSDDLDGWIHLHVGDALEALSEKYCIGQGNHSTGKPALAKSLVMLMSGCMQEEAMSKSFLHFSVEDCLIKAEGLHEAFQRSSSTGSGN